MAIWKKLNPETGEYEPIENSDSGGGGIAAMDTLGVADAYTAFPMADVADNTSVGATMTTYTLSGLIEGDTVTMKRSYNGEGGIIVADGVDITGLVIWSNYVYGTLTLDRAYGRLVIKSHNGHEKYATVIRRTPDMMTRPAVNGEFVPTVSDAEKSSIKTLSSRKLREDYGMDVQKARSALSGGVWIALGDSYTVYAEPYF